MIFVTWRRKQSLKDNKGSKSLCKGVRWGRRDSAGSGSVDSSHQQEGGEASPFFMWNPVACVEGLTDDAPLVWCPSNPRQDFLHCLYSPHERCESLSGSPLLWSSHIRSRSSAAYNRGGDRGDVKTVEISGSGSEAPHLLVPLRVPDDPLASLPHHDHLGSLDLNICIAGHPR